MNYKETRPWGTFENLLDVDYCKVKQIVIKPGEAPKLSVPL
jgi:mannose-6-phosphate isomerase-like protein (cupin superfamily)